MKIFKLKLIIIVSILLGFTAPSTSVSFAGPQPEEELRNEDYNKQLMIEMELLDKLKSRFNLISETGGTSRKSGLSEDGNVIKVFGDVNGLIIIKKLYEFGIYLYSVEATEIPLKDVLKELARANDMDILFERVEPAFLKRRIDVALANVTFQDILEIVTGMFGLDFLFNNDKSLKITTPSNMGIDTPLEYFNSKIIKTYRKAQIKYPSNEFIPETYFKLGNFFSSMGLKIIASQEFAVVAERYPKHELVKDTLINLAQCYMDLGDLKKARDVYNGFINRFPYDESLIDIYWDLTDTWYQQGKYGISISIYKKILEMFPKSGLSGKIRERIVSSYMKREEYSKAFNTLIVLKKRRDFKWDVKKDFLLGKCLYRMGKYQDSFMIFADIVKNKGLSEKEVNTANYIIADCLYKTNNHMESIQMFKKWIIENGNDAYAMLVIGKSLRTLNLFDTGIEILSDALVNFSDSTYGGQITHELAMTHYMNAEYEQATNLWGVIAEDENSKFFMDSNFYIAESLLLDKKFNDAIVQYNKLIPFYENRSLTTEETERFQLIKNHIGTCYQSIGLVSKALDAYGNEVR